MFLNANTSWIRRSVKELNTTLTLLPSLLFCMHHFYFYVHHLLVTDVFSSFIITVVFICICRQQSLSLCFSSGLGTFRQNSFCSVIMVCSILIFAWFMLCLSSARYAVIAFGCASCPKITCGREGCGTEFCYHCKQLWHPNQTCDAARQQRAQSLRLRTVRSSSLSYSQESGAAGWLTGHARTYFLFLLFSFSVFILCMFVKSRIQLNVF